MVHGSSSCLLDGNGATERLKSVKYIKFVIGVFEAGECHFAAGLVLAYGLAGNK